MERYNFRQTTRRRHFWGPDEDDDDLFQVSVDGPMTGAGYDMDQQYMNKLRVNQIEERAFRQVLEQYQRFPIETTCKSNVYGVIEMTVREELMKHDMYYGDDYTIRFMVMSIPTHMIESCMKEPVQQLESPKKIDWSMFQQEDEDEEMVQDYGDIGVEIEDNPYEHVFRSYVDANPFSTYDINSATGGGRGTS